MVGNAGQAGEMVDACDVVGFAEWAGAVDTNVSVAEQAFADHVGCLALRLHQQPGDIADPANEAVDVGRWPDNFRHFFSDPAKGIRQEFFQKAADRPAIQLNRLKAPKTGLCNRWKSTDKG